MEKQIETYIQSELQKLSQIKNKFVEQSINKDIFEVIKAKKFRRYFASDTLLKNIEEAINYNVAKKSPINFTFLQGSYKLWRLKESPKVDWAEFFALIHYSTLVKPILAMYEPGVVFDFYVDDLIMERISNYTRDEILSYHKSFKDVMDFIVPYCPENLRFKITTVSSRFHSEADFWNKLSNAIEKQENPEKMKLNDSMTAMIDLNYRQTLENNLDVFWREKLMRIHNAHSSLEERLEYRQEKGKILAMPHHYTGSDSRLFLGSTRDSIVKYWIGVGALKIKAGGFLPTVLSPKQLSDAKFSIHQVEIKGLDANNFRLIRVLK